MQEPQEINGAVQSPEAASLFLYHKGRYYEKLVDVLACYCAIVWTVWTMSFVRSAIESRSMSQVLQSSAMAICPPVMVIAACTILSKYGKEVARFTLRVVYTGGMMLLLGTPLTIAFGQPRKLIVAALFCAMWLVIGALGFIYLTYFERLSSLDVLRSPRDSECKRGYGSIDQSLNQV